MSNKFQELTLPRPSIFMRLLAKWRKGKLVWLQDFRDEIYLTIATQDKYGTLTCPVYPTTKVGNVILLPRGKISLRSESSYIRQWRYA